MKPDTTVQLGDFVFQDFEVPEHISFGGDQMLAVHKLIGGMRVVDAMGRDDAPLEWSGRFRGADAMARADTLDAMRIAGLPLQLTWGSKAYTVIIGSFRPDYTRSYEIPYGISCTVVSDLASPTIDSQGKDLDDQMDGDMADAMDAGDEIGDDTLSGLLADLSSAIDDVEDFASATRDQLNQVIAPLFAAQRQVSTLISAGAQVIDTVTTIGGVLPFAPFGFSAAALADQISGFGQQASLYGLQSILGRMSTNIAADGVSGRVITMAGGDLYHLAADQYGDATAWTTIARANGLTDPVLSGVQTLTVPQSPDGDDGVLTS